MRRFVEVAQPSKRALREMTGYARNQRLRYAPYIALFD